MKLIHITSFKIVLTMKSVVKCAKINKICSYFGNNFQFWIFLLLIFN